MLGNDFPNIFYQTADDVGAQGAMVLAYLDARVVGSLLAHTLAFPWTTCIQGRTNSVPHSSVKQNSCS